MSSIAYVTEQNMLEYHRLCCNRSILFWRLTTKNRFTDFRKGDLLFFFARGAHYRKKKGFIGYGHYAYTRKLSVNQMWRQYGTMTGYDTKDQLIDAISKAGKGQVPESMLCLFLEDVVFFTAPIYPKEVGLHIPMNLESYCYLDKNDENVTIKILKQAEKYGIDLWSYDGEHSPSQVFYRDITRQVVSNACMSMPKETGTSTERPTIHRLMKEKCLEDGWEPIIGSKTTCMRFDGQVVEIALPFVYNTQDHAQRRLELMGHMYIYRSMLKKDLPLYQVKFTVLYDGEQDKEIESLMELVNE